MQRSLEHVARAALMVFIFLNWFTSGLQRAVLSLMRRGDNNFAGDIWNSHQIKFFDTFSRVILGRNIIQDGILTHLFIPSHTTYLLGAYYVPGTVLGAEEALLELPLHHQPCTLSNRDEVLWPQKTIPSHGPHPSRIKFLQLGREGSIRRGTSRGNCLRGSLLQLQSSSGVRK